MFHSDLKGNNLHISRIATGTGTPVGNIIPSIVGEGYFDLVDKTIVRQKFFIQKFLEIDEIPDDLSAEEWEEVLTIARERKDKIGSRGNSKYLCGLPVKSRG